MEKPFHLDMAERCKAWNALPYDGGVLDQPDALMQQMETAISARDGHIRSLEYERTIETMKRAANAGLQ